MTTTSPRALVATRKGLFTIARDEAGWGIRAVAFAGDNVPMVLSDRRDGSIYAVLSHGHFGSKMHRSVDGGITWTEIAVPKYPPKPADEIDIDPMRKTPVNWNLELIWALEAGGADQPGTLWAGTIPGALFRSDDCGASWQIIRSLWDRPERKRWFGGGMDQPGIHSICVDPRDARHVTIAVSCGGVWQTRDGGETWEVSGPGLRAAFMPPELQLDPVIQDPHHLVACPANPDALWTQHHNGIFRSTDGAASWTEVSAAPSSFGFAVAVHPRDPDTAWFIPAIKDEKRIPVEGRLVVTRTRDGGRTFETLTRGLPQSWAYDLVYRHGLDVDRSGARLLFGSTTGNLWLSEDGGDSWQALANHLPPIYCVRFA
jgi:photosystem II stability/assembly factor-like uncharacterized protein